MMGICLGTRQVGSRSSPIIARALGSHSHSLIVLCVCVVSAGLDGSRPTRRCLSFSLTYTGKESHAVVEYAPFQKVPAEKKKTDARNNTIDKGRWDRFPLIVHLIYLCGQMKITSLFSRHSGVGQRPSRRRSRRSVSRRSVVR